MAESVLGPTCRLLIIDCHERHVGPFGPSTNVVCQLRPALALHAARKCRQLAKNHCSSGLRQLGQLYRATPPFGRMKTYFPRPLLFVPKLVVGPLTLFVSLPATFYLHFLPCILFIG